MAIQWGDTVSSSSGQSFAVGIDASVSGTTVTATYYFWAGKPISYNGMYYNKGGAISGTTTFGAYSAGQITIGTWSFTGSRGQTYSLGASVSNTYNGLSPNVWISVSIPALVPSTPAEPTISNITTTNIRVNGSPPDNNGSAITTYAFQASSDMNFNVGEVIHNSSVLDINWLQPDTTYYFRFRAYNAVGWSWYSPIVSARTAKLPSSIPTIDKSSVTLSTTSPPTITLSTNRQNATYKHNLSFNFGTYTGNIITDKSLTTSYTWTPDLAIHAKEIPNKDSDYGVLILTTYDASGNLLGTNNVKYTVTLPDNIKPTTGNITLSEYSTLLTDAAKAKGYYLGVSRVGISTSAGTGIYNSTISKSDLSVASDSWSASGAATVSGTYVPTSSGSKALTYTVTDSRGMVSATKSQTITINQYTIPKINSFNVYRCTSSGTPDAWGTYARANINITGSTAPGLSNNLTIKIQYRLKGSTGNYSSGPTTTTSGGTVSYNNTSATFQPSGGFLTDKAYEFVLLVNDQVYANSVSVGDTMTNSRVAMSWSGEGVGVGKVWEQGILDVGTADDTTYLNGNLNAYGNVNFMPTGSIMPYAGISAPTGWLLCDGSTLSTTSYPALFAIIGYTYGGSGASFRVPDLRGRVPVGVDPNDSQLNTLGKQGGEKTHTLTVDEMPNHDHGLTGYSVLWGQSSQNVQFVVGSSYVQATASGTSGNSVGTNQNSLNKTRTTGGGAAHNNMQPYILLNYIIRSL